MASVSVVPASGLRGPGGNTVGINNLPSEMNDMKIRDEKVNYVPCSSYSCIGYRFMLSLYKPLGM